MICFLETSLYCVPFDFNITMTGMGDDMFTIASKVDFCMPGRYTHRFHMSHVLGFQVPSSSSYVHYAPPVKIGFYLRHLICGLRLPPSHFLLEVLWFYKVHLVHLCPNAVL